MNQLVLNQDCYLEHPIIDFFEFSKSFQGVELDYTLFRTIWGDDLQLKQVLKLLESYNLKAVSMYALKDFSLSSDKVYKLEIIKNLEHLTNICYRIECDLIVLEPSFLEESELVLIPKWRIIRRTVKRLSELLKIADQKDLTLGIEFLSRSNCSLNNMEDIKEIFKNLEEKDNLGIILDVFHFLKNQTELSELNDIINDLLLVRVCDLQIDPNIDFTSIKDADRVFPGKGNSARDVIKHLFKKQYRNPFSLKLNSLESKESKNMIFQQFDAYIKRLK